MDSVDEVVYGDYMLGFDYCFKKTGKILNLLIFGISNNYQKIEMIRNKQHIFDTMYNQEQQEIWMQMDQLEQNLCQAAEQPLKKPTPRKPSKKADKQTKIQQIEAYERALVEHRKHNSQYYGPFQTDTPLNIEDCDKLINFLDKAIDEEKDAAIALRLLGLKRLKVLFKCGAVEQFQAIIQYVKTRTLPEWMKMKYHQLLARKY